MHGTKSAHLDRMALREFTDGSGNLWRVWDITPEQMHPRTLAEDYMQGILDGWLTFERVDGRGKRRLMPIPENWASRSEDELRALCDQAEPVKTGTRKIRSAERRIPIETEEPSAPDPAPDSRTFRYPGGRVWIAQEVSMKVPAAVADEPAEYWTILRFTSGERTMDLLTWPRDWMHYTDAELSDLLYRSFPRESTGTNPTPFQRRRDDRPSATMR